MADAEKEEDWKPLLGLLECKIVIDEDGFDAARRLARHAVKTVPWMVASMARWQDQRTWVAYALGLCGSEKAIQALRIGALQDFNDVEGMIFALDLAGEPGRKVLEELETSGDSYAKQFIRLHYGKARSWQYAGAEYPIIPKDLNLR